VGQLAGAVRGARSVGGQPHNLRKVLASLPDDERDDIRALLADPETDWAVFFRALKATYPDARHMTESTWRRWGKECREDPTWWAANGTA
jgi:hypothetical protein